METENPSTDRRLADLADQVRLLQARVEELTQRVDVLSSSSRISRVSSASPEVDAVTAGEATLSAWPLTGQGGLLSGLAAACFVLVVALVLRTITENGIVGQQAGSWLGMGYAALLMLLGRAMLASGTSLAPVFAAAGTCLMMFIVLETHQRFHSLPSPTAYGVLLGVLFFMGVVALRRERPFLLCLTVLGVSAVGIVLGFDKTNPLLLGSLLLGSNVIAYKASRVRGCTVLRWLTFAATLVYAFVWADRLRSKPIEELLANEALMATWLLPVSGVFAATFTYLVIRRVQRHRTPLGVFDAVVMLTSFLGSYGIAWTFLGGTPGGATMTALVGLAVSGTLLVVAGWLSRRELGGALAIGAFCSTGVLLGMAASLGVAQGALPLLIAWPLGALGLAFLALFLGPVFLWTSYFLGVSGAVLAVATKSMSVPPIAFGETAGIMAFAAAVCLLHYLRFRRVALPTLKAEAGGRSVVERASIFVFLAGLVFAFGALRLILYQTLAGLELDPEQTFSCAQSVLINLGAIMLLFLALAGKSKELFWVAVAVGVVGALKVLGVDLISERGVALVLSVFSVGVTTTLGSFVLRRIFRSEPISA